MERSRKNFQHLKDVSTLKYDPEKCKGCSICLKVCPRQVLSWADGEKKKVAVTDSDSCIECGACMLNCPFGALSVEAGAGCAIAILNGLMKNTKPCC